MKKIMIFTLGVLLSCSIFAQNSMQDRTNSWTKEPPMTTGRPGGTERDGESPSTNPNPGPVGDTAWALILGLGAAYGFYVFNRKRKAINE